MARAASTARRTSSRSISRGRAARTMPPRLLTPRMWLPATPTMADSTGTPATPSASSSARRMELTAASRLTISPLRVPLDSAAPMARNLRAAVFDVGDQGAGLGAANVQRHEVTIFLRQLRQLPQNFLATSHVIERLGSSHARLVLATALAGATRRERRSLSGLTTTCREKRRSTDSTRPALARHWPIFSTQQAIFVHEIGVAETH